MVPAVGWGDERSFEFCFDGIQKDSTVAVSTLGVKRNREAYLRGFEEMKKRIDPERILCYDRPFPEMERQVIWIPYTRGEDSDG